MRTVGAVVTTAGAPLTSVEAHRRSHWVGLARHSLHGEAHGPHLAISGRLTCASTGGTGNGDGVKKRSARVASSEPFVGSMMIWI